MNTYFTSNVIWLQLEYKMSTLAVSHVAFLMYARSSVITDCRQIGLTTVHAYVDLYAVAVLQEIHTAK